MAFKYRSDLVGKRFLCIYANHCSDHCLENLKTKNTTNSINKNSQNLNDKCSNKCFNSTDELKKIDIKNWPWKSGIIRASSHRDSHNPDLSVLVEFDSQCWQKREWIKIYEQDHFQLFLIEYILVWNNRKQTIFNHVLNWPALNFKIYVDKIGFNEHKFKPIEYLDDNQLDFVIYDELKKFEEISLDQERSTIENNDLRLCVNEWADFQKQQKVLLKTPSILMGYRVQVYRAIGTTQWYTAVIKSYDETTKELILTDDTVLEEHYEDPTLIQMKLIGNGVINSILKGEDQGIVPRRRACTQNINSSTYNNSRRTNNSSNSFTSSFSNSSSISVNNINSQQLNNLNSNSNCNFNSNLNSKTAASTYVTTNSSFSSTHLSSSLNKNFKNVLSSETKFTPISSTSNLLSSSSNDSTKLLSNSSETINNSTVCFNNDLKNSCKLNSGLSNFNTNQGAKKNLKTQKSDTDNISVLNDDGSKIKNLHQRNDKLEDKSIDNSMNDLLFNSKTKNLANTFAKAEFIDFKNNSIENILKNTTDKKSSIKQLNHFRPAPMLSQVTKSKAPTYLMQLNKPNSLQHSSIQSDTKNINDTMNTQSLTNFNSNNLANINNSLNNYTTFIPPLSSSLSSIKTKQNKIQKNLKNSINNLEDQANLSINHSFNQLQAFSSSDYLGLWNHSASINQLSNINQLINQDYKLSNNQTTTSSEQVETKLDKKQQNIFNLLNSNVNIPNQINSIIYEKNKVLDCSSINNSKKIGDILSQEITKNLTAQQNSFVFNTNSGDKIDLNDYELKQNLGTQPIVPNKSYLIDSSINSLNFENKQDKSNKIFSNNSLFSIASICKKELNSLEKINISIENKCDKLSSVVVAENVDSNISESSSSNGQYKKLKNVWLHRHSQNNNDQSNKNNSTNPLELLADTSLKQFQDEADTIKQETDLNCKEKFKFSPFLNADKKNDSEDTEEEEEENVQKLSINNDDCDTSISSSNNNFTSDSEIEENKLKKKIVKKGRKSLKDQAKNLNKKIKKIGKEVVKNNKKSRLSKRSNKEVTNVMIDNNSQNSNCSSNSEREISIRSSALAATGKILSSKNSSNSNSKNLIEQPSIFSNLPVSLLKKTGESFLQDGSCAEVAPKLNRCRECRMTPNQRKKKIPNIFCRFYAFRKLKYGRNGILQSASFSKSEDANEQEIYFWLPKFLKKNKHQNLDFTTSLYLLQHVGDQLCDLINEELRAMKMHCGIDRSISWKRVVQGIREMCDVCETTLFNIHWTCHDCGFVLCIDCYGARLNCDGTPGDAVPPLSCDNSSNSGNDRDAYQWLLCQNDQPHEQSKLVMTQIVADRVLNDMAKKLHKIRSKLRINCNSICCKDGTSNLNGLCFSDEECDENLSTSSEQSQSNQISNSLNENISASNLINSLINKPHNKENKNQLLNSSNVNNNLDLNITSSMKKTNKPLAQLTPDDEKRKALEFFALKRDRKLLNANYMPSRCCKIEHTKRKYPEVPHSWLCEGRLLCLENSSLNDKNLDLFQEQWLRGQPLIITGIHEKLSNELWNPEQLSVKMTDFTCKGNGLYDCRTSNSVRIPLRRFWEGFENVNRRAKDSNGDPLILKLKDWPPGDDFCDLMPDHFSEFFDCIPLPIYTKREGKLNLAARLPDSFVRPDLGPKMYTAYGCDVNAPDVGTANLHLDVSDAVNVLVYVSVPKCKDDLQQKQLNYLLNLSDIDQITKKKIRDKDSKIGALWHIYEAKDADKIREFLKKISAERGKPLAASMDPIHDQSWYLNKELRDRLRNEFNVNGYSIVQCLGDAVFIPAGSPHQVRNIHSAIKLACDFVSPENISRCFELTAQFRMLSNFHTNHEDKLQVKNIIYHAIKDALTVLDLESQLLPSNYLESHYNREASLKNYEESLLSSQQEIFVEENKRDALKSANLNEGISNKSKTETNTTKRNKNMTNERAKRSKLNENTTQPQNLGNDLNNNSPKRKRDELSETKTFKKNRKEHKKTIKIKS